MRSAWARSKRSIPDGYIQDNGDLSMTFFIDDSVMMLSAVITQMKLWPKPAGIAAVDHGFAAVTDGMGADKDGICRRGRDRRDNKDTTIGGTDAAVNRIRTKAHDDERKSQCSNPTSGTRQRR